MHLLNYCTLLTGKLCRLVSSYLSVQTWELMFAAKHAVTVLTSLISFWHYVFTCQFIHSSFPSFNVVYGTKKPDYIEQRYNEFCLVSKVLIFLGTLGHILSFFFSSSHLLVSIAEEYILPYTKNTLNFTSVLSRRKTGRPKISPK